MRIIEEEQLDFSDVLIQPKCSKILSRSQVNLEREFKWYDEGNVKHIISCIPVGCSNMGTVGTIKMAELMVKNNHFSYLEKHISFEDVDNLFERLSEHERDLVVPSIGIKEDTEGLFRFYDRWNVKMIMIDVPNGYIPSLTERIKKIRSHCKNNFIIAGNVVDAAGAAQIIDAGANAVKVGIGNGAVCVTRLKTGVGRPQLSTIIEVADICHQKHAYVMADGGVASPGDVCKAFGAGADFVISGSLFAGCEESESETVVLDGKKYKQYYGMSSHLAQEKHFGGVRKYSASEGREKLVPYTGSLESVLQDIDGGLRSCCTYIGCDKMKNFSRHTTFYKVHNQLNMLYANCPDIKH